MIKNEATETSTCEICAVALPEDCEGWCDTCYEAHLQEIGYYELHHYVEDEWSNLS
jgi:hypothetical protein